MASKKNKSFFKSKGWKTGMGYLYGWGAAVVILGALFKILHLPGANEMLIIGMGTETVIFFLSAFEPVGDDEQHWDWDKVFPQLNMDIEPDELEIAGGPQAAGAVGPNMGGVKDALASQPINQEMIDSLTDSIKGLKMNVENLADISDVTVATNEFSAKLKGASGKMDQLSAGYGTTVEAIAGFGASMKEAGSMQQQALAEVKNYQEQVKNVTKNLQSLNSVYELELQDAQKHLNSINKFYGSITGVMQNLVDTSKDTESLRQQVGNLATNMTALNTIYGNMLSAMASASSMAKK